MGNYYNYKIKMLDNIYDASAIVEPLQNMLFDTLAEATQLHHHLTVM